MNRRSNQGSKKSNKTSPRLKNRGCARKLHEDVICHILSRLPAKDAVRTSVLCKGWKYKWTSIYNIDIDDWEQVPEQRGAQTRLLGSLDKIFLLPHDLRSIRILSSRPFQSSRLKAWISAAVKRNIESIECQRYHPKSCIFPGNILNNATSLKKLKLTSCTLPVSIDNYFPSLIHLYLENVEILNEFSDSCPLVFNVPVLKTLELIHCNWLNLDLVEIYSPALSTFKCQTALDAKASEYSIRICDGTRLEKFESDGGFPENIDLDKSSVLNLELKNREGDIDLQSGIQIQKLLKGLRSVTSLHLSSWVCKAIAQSELCLPKFNSLQRLVLNVDGNTKLLIKLLHAAPALEYLETDWGHFPSLEELYWNVSNFVPHCIEYVLKEVKFNYVYNEPPLNLAKFFLVHGRVLRKVHLKGYGAAKDEIAEQLLECPRGSTYLAIVSGY